MVHAVQRDDEFVRLFEEEASVRLGRLAQQVPQLRGPMDQDLMASIFRDAHSLRGAAAVVGLEPVQRVAHAVETLLEPVWRGHLPVTPGLVDATESAVSELKVIIPEVIAGEDVSARAAAVERSLEAATVVPAGAGPETNGPQPTPADRAEPTSGSMVPGRGRVLVVDDAAAVREIQRSILERAGYEVRTARDGVEALEILGRERCAAIVADIEMPRMDGYALIGAVRASPWLAGIPIIVLTTRSEDERRRSIEAGADEFITKEGFDTTVFLAVVGGLVEGRR